MTRLSLSLTLGSLLAGLAACGTTDLDRAVSGAAIGASAATVIEANPVTGAAIGAAAGVLVDPADVNLGPGPVDGS